MSSQNSSCQAREFQLHEHMMRSINNTSLNSNGNNSSTKNNNISNEHSSVEVENAQELSNENSSGLTDVRWYKSARTCTAFMSALGYTFFYLLRVNLSLAMVFMVSDQQPAVTKLPGDSRMSTRNRTDVSKFVINNSTLFVNHSFVQSSSATKEPTSSIDEIAVDFINATFSLPEHPRTTTAHQSTFQKELSERIEDECSDVTLTNEGHERKYKGEFLWSKEMTGYILSSFFYGYIVTQFPGGWLATRFGTKHIFGGGMFISIVATFLTPLAARSHPYLLIALRVLIGLAHGAGFPATHVLYSLWFPPLERTRYITFSHAGTMAGSIVALSVSGFICDIPIDNGWPFIFYIYGAASLLWFILWNYFVYDSPLKHPRIDPIEREYIVSKIGLSVYGDVMHRERIPWSHLLRSLPVWAIVVTHLGNNWANYTILVCIPLFMKEVLKFDTKENGVLSSLPYVLSFFVSIGSGQLADLLIRKDILSTTNTRKLFQLLSSGIPAILLVVIGFIDCRNRYWAVLLLCLIVSINSLCRAGFMVNHVDIAPRYAGLLFGISNTLGTTPGILSPIVVGKLTTTGTREEWLIVFNICAALLVGSCIFYLIFGDGKLQKWSSPSIVEVRTVTCEKTNPSDDGISDRLVTKM